MAYFFAIVFDFWIPEVLIIFFWCQTKPHYLHNLSVNLQWKTVLLGWIYFLLISLSEAAHLHTSSLFTLLLSIHTPLQHLSSTFYSFLFQILFLPHFHLLSLLNFLSLPFASFFLCPLWLMSSFSVPPSSFPPFMISNNLEVDSSFFFPPLCCFFPLSLLSSPFLSSCPFLPADFIFPTVCIACGPLTLLMWLGTHCVLVSGEKTLSVVKP